MIREITSTANPLVKKLRALATSKKARQQSNTFIVEGWRGLSTLLTQNSPHYQIEQLFITPNWVNDPRLPTDLDTILLPNFVFEKISDVKNAQGILGIVRFSTPPFKFSKTAGHYLLLDSIRDPGNLGTLIRSAVGASYDGILLHGDCVDPYNPKVIRATMGTFAFADIWSITTDDLDALLAADYTLGITTGQGGENLYESTFSNKHLLAIGSEAHGICKTLQQRATQHITIPLADTCESLNAAIAGSICMFQIKSH